MVCSMLNTPCGAFGKLRRLGRFYFYYLFLRPLWSDYRIIIRVSL